MLKKQIARLKALGLTAMMATELEFFLFEKSFRRDPQGRLPRPDADQRLQRGLPYPPDHQGRGGHAAGAQPPLCRRHPGGKHQGRGRTGQEELNIRYAEALDCADHHTIAKHAVKEIAWAKGRAATFLPKWNQDAVGSSSHVHQSLWKDGKAGLPGRRMATTACPKLMRHYMAGLIEYAPTTPASWRPM
jgi:glutamine synthetase